MFGREVLPDAEQRLGVNSLRDLGKQAVELSALVGIRRYVIDEVKLCEDDGTVRAKYTNGEISYIVGR